MVGFTVKAKRSWTIKVYHPGIMTDTWHFVQAKSIFWPYGGACNVIAIFPSDCLRYTNISYLQIKMFWLWWCQRKGQEPLKTKEFILWASRISTVSLIAFCSSTYLVWWKCNSTCFTCFSLFTLKWWTLLLSLELKSVFVPNLWPFHMWAIF